MKQLLAILIVILAIPSVFAATCASSADLEAQATECTTSGKSAVYSYDDYGCKYVTCSSCSTDIDAAVSKCKAAGLDYSTYLDDHDCKQVRCIEPEATCPTAAELEESRTSCRDQDLGYYSKYNKYDCEYIVCGSSACQTESEYAGQIAKCKEYGKSYESFTDDHGCKYVKCVDKECPDISEDAAKCAKAGLKADTYELNGCKQVKCGAPVYQCKKLVDGDCIIISCTDGFAYNSCDSACPPTLSANQSLGAETADDATEKKGFFARLFGIFK